MGANSSAPSDSPTLLNMYTTPPVAYEIMSEPDLFYVHLLFALKVRVRCTVRSCVVSLAVGRFRVFRVCLNGAGMCRTSIWGVWRPTS